MIEIRKDIPVPDRYSGKGQASNKYPISELEVGDSFEAPVESERSVRSMVARLNLISEDGKQYVCRKLNKNTVGVWRIL